MVRMVLGGENGGEHGGGENGGNNGGENGGENGGGNGGENGGGNRARSRTRRAWKWAWKWVWKWAWKWAWKWVWKWVWIFFCGDFIIKSFSFDEAKSPRRQACNAFSATASGTISTTILTTISTPIFTPLSPPFLPPCNVPSDVLGWLGAAWGLTALAQFDPSQSKAIQKVLGRSTAIRLVRANQKQPTSCGTAAGRNENTQKLLISGIPSIPSDHTCEAHQSHSSRGRFFVSPESQGRKKHVRERPSISTHFSFCSAPTLISPKTLGHEIYFYTRTRWANSMGECCATVTLAEHNGSRSSCLDEGP